MKMNKFRVFGTAALLVTAAVFSFFVNGAIHAHAFGPSVLFSPTGSCSRSYCDLYPKSVQLANGNILVAFEDDTQPATTQNFPIYSSTNNGATWSHFSSVPYSGPRQGWINWTNPFFYTLPQAIGTMPAGTLLLAGIAAPPDKSATAVVLYSSHDNGLTWTYVSEVASGGGQTGSNLTPIWEPNLLNDHSSSSSKVVEAGYFGSGVSRVACMVYEEQRAPQAFLGRHRYQPGSHPFHFLHELSYQGVQTGTALRWYPLSV